MSDNSINKHLKNKVTIQDLENSSHQPLNYNQKDYSAFSTAVRKDKLQMTFDKTYDHAKYQNNSVPNSIQKFKTTLSSYQKQFKQRPKFKQTQLLTPNFDNQNRKGSKQKQNNHHQLNSLPKIQPNSGIGYQQASFRSDLQWGSGTKKETADLVRKLFGSSGKDYNLEYRKKKFFQNFKIGE